MKNKFFIKYLIFGIIISFFLSCQNDKKKETKEEKTDPVVMEKIKKFFKNPEKSSYQISPDGKYFSFKAPYERRMNIFIQEIGKDKEIQLTKDTARDLSGYFWANNERILYLKDTGGDENFQLYGVNIDGTNLKALTAFEGVRTRIIDVLEDFPGWMTDHKGKLRVAFVSDGVNQSILYRKTEKEKFENVITLNFKENLSPIFFDFDNGDIVYAASNLGRDKAAIIKYDLSKKKEIKEIFKHPEVDVYNLHYSRKRKVLTSISYTTWKKQRHFLDKEVENLIKRLEKELKGYEVGITGISKDETKYMVIAYSDRSRGCYYFYDKKTDKLTKIHEIAPWLNEKELSEMKPIKYKSRDGFTINGYLSLPKGKEKAKNLPVILNVHWGGKMQNDLTDGVNWLIKKGIADKNRVAIYGASYGGYATLAGLVHTPDLYACGIDYVGVSNLFTFMKTIPPYWSQYLAMLYEQVGHPQKDSLLLAAKSPALNADKIKSPLFVAQGAKDPRVNIQESDQMVKAMKKRGVVVEYMVKENEGHGFHNEENKFEFYEAMNKFLKKHMNK
ncbi:MAG: S9 family peptidase [Bacteroidetes bacterium 4572_128]|nr:MAG: S9 family peptidase [Bacteroidetes bacterium 4572_128]